MESILPCNPKILMQPLPDSCCWSQGLRSGKQSRPAPLLSLDLHLLGSRGVQSTWTSLQPGYSPLATEVSHWLATRQHGQAPGTAPVSPHLPLRGSLSRYPPSFFPFCPEREGQRSRHKFHPGNFSYALLSQGESHPSVFHLYQDCLHTFVMKGSVQWKDFLNYLYG